MLFWSFWTWNCNESIITVTDNFLVEIPPAFGTSSIVHDHPPYQFFLLSCFVPHFKVFVLRIIRRYNYYSNIIIWSIRYQTSTHFGHVLLEMVNILVPVTLSQWLHRHWVGLFSEEPVIFGTGSGCSIFILLLKWTILNCFKFS